MSMRSLCEVQVDTFMFLIYLAQREEEQGRLNRLARRTADRARIFDEYELAPDTHAVGSAQTRIFWFNLEWTIEDFLSLLIAADDLELARTNVEFDGDDPRVQEILAAAAQDPYPSAILRDAVVAPNRVFLKCFLLWYAVYFDTRVQRLFCKGSNVLHDELQLAWPPQRKVLTMRRHLYRCLGAYILGYSTRAFFSHAVEMAYTRGANLIPTLEESPADLDAQADPSEWLFDPHASAFGAQHLYATRLVIRSAAPAPPTSLLDLDRSSSSSGGEGGGEGSDDAGGSSPLR